MFSSWLSSWYHQPQQIQEPFNDHYEPLDEDWIKVKTTKERQPVQDPTDERTEGRDERTEKEAPIVEKKISRQERRAQLRLAAKEKKKQARNALRKSTNCILSSGPLSIDH
ncbi:hypothetical protein RMATCC62417_06032 [Rhizopus microsporus]|nr:hypothetical protein RMATCC62417_06032 [Rhizopus microsporus]